MLTGGWRADPLRGGWFERRAGARGVSGCQPLLTSSARAILRDPAARASRPELDVHLYLSVAATWRT